MSLLCAVLEVEKESEESTKSRIFDADEARATIAAARSAAAEIGERLRHCSARPAEVAAASAERRRLVRERLAALAPLAPLRGPLAAELEAARAAFARVDRSAACRERLAAAKRALERRRYREASALLARAHDELRDDADDDADLATAVALKRAECEAEVARRWRERVRWTSDGERVRLGVDVGDGDGCFQEALDALFASGRIDVEVSRLADFIVETVIPTLLARRCEVRVERDAARVDISIDALEKLDEPARPCLDASHFVDSTIAFFEALQSCVDCRWEDGRSVFSILGRALGSRLLAPLLDSAPPRDLERLDEFFAEMGFPRVTRSDSFRSNPEETTSLLALARRLASADLAASVVDVESSRAPRRVPVDEVEMLGKAALEGSNSEGSPTDDPFLLAPRRISSGVREIVRSMALELEKGRNAPPKMRGTILAAVRNAFELYYVFAAEHHRDACDRNPSDSALFHNNCTYLAHSILSFAHKRAFDREYAQEIMMHLADQVQNLRTAAILRLSATLKAQRNFLKDRIEKSELKDLGMKKSIGREAEVSICVCLTWLKKLQACWQPILSSETYENAMTELTDFLCEQLVDAILALKEIAIGEDLALDISNVYSRVTDQIPSIFPDNEEIENKCKNYARLTNLISILRSPMFTIATKWRESNQKSKVFSCEEIKHLIRILFPGNPQKSIVLDSIK